MNRYEIVFWTGEIKTVDATSAYEAALTIWDAEYLYSYSVDQDLLDGDEMVVMSVWFDQAAVIRSIR